VLAAEAEALRQKVEGAAREAALLALVTLGMGFLFASTLFAAALMSLALSCAGGLPCPRRERTLPAARGRECRHYE